eukprot:COSAG02_NODE_30274_length_554_cov_0.986813_1_plen_133_part_10
MQLDGTEQATQDSNARTVDDQNSLLQLMQIAAAARQEQDQQVVPQPYQRHEQQDHHDLQPKFKRSATNDFHAPAVYRPRPTDHRTTATVNCAPSAPGQKLYGPTPGVRHKTFGNPPPDEHGHLRLVTHPAGRN